MSNLEHYRNVLKPMAFNPKNGFVRLGRNDPDLFSHAYDDDDLLIQNLDPFTVDTNKIINSKAFRRLIEKTQVFPLPNNPHIRTRLQHCLEVWAIALPLAEFLGLNITLCQSISLGHDIGHAPFGHFGEEYLSRNSGRVFNHANNGVIVAQQIERKCSGLNLTVETLKGILLHSRTADEKMAISESHSQESSLVMLADKIAYTFSDYNDALREDYFTEPNSSKINFFGTYQRERVSRCMRALIIESAEKGSIAFSTSAEAQAFKYLRHWMFRNIYKPIDYSVQECYLNRLIDFMQSELLFRNCDPYLLLSLMTDREVFQFGEFCNTARKPKIEQLKNFGIMEIAPSLSGRKIDFDLPQKILSYKKTP